MLVKTGMKKEAKDKAGVPGVKKIEMTGKKSFVVHADGGNYFEGEITDPSVKLKGSGKITFTNLGNQCIDNPCWDCANNHYHNEVSEEFCDTCERKTHSNFKQK